MSSQFFIGAVAKEIFLSLNLPAKEPPTNDTEEAAEVKDAEPEIAGVGLKCGGNGTVYKSEVKVSICKVFNLLYIQTQIDCKSLRFW